MPIILYLDIRFSETWDTFRNIKRVEVTVSELLLKIIFRVPKSLHLLIKVRPRSISTILTVPKHGL